MRIVSNIAYIRERRVWRHSVLYFLERTPLEPRYLRVKVREKCYVFSFLDSPRSGFVSSTRKKKKNALNEKVGVVTMIEIKSLMNRRIVAFSSRFRRTELRNTPRGRGPCERGREALRSVLGPRAINWRGGGIGGGDFRGRLDRALLYSEAISRAPCSIDRLSEKSRWSVLGSAHDSLHRNTWASNSFPHCSSRGNEVFDWISSVVGSRITRRMTLFQVRID